MKHKKKRIIAMIDLVLLVIEFDGGGGQRCGENSGENNACGFS